ncbi:MAG: hypothetical protein K2X03_07865 [Bryobacteraceae bacterium]|nr:hypothetical protein [Bryobacteraceae bacterium]
MMSARVPPGRYQIEVRQALLGTFRSVPDLVLNRSAHFLTIAMRFDLPLIRWTETGVPETKGQLFYRGKPFGPAWLKVVAVNGNAVAETWVDETGSFSVQSLNEGDYVAVVISKALGTSVSRGTVSGSDVLGLRIE